LAVDVVFERLVVAAKAMVLIILGGRADETVRNTKSRQKSIWIGGAGAFGGRRLWGAAGILGEAGEFSPRR
jgi:DhnA family fructose-bisphosphate aldolase class Ia